MSCVSSGVTLVALILKSSTAKINWTNTVSSYIQCILEYNVHVVFERQHEERKIFLH